MMRKNHPKTKSRVLCAACEIFAKKGFSGTTVAEICDAADANISAVNYYFGDKETLYDEVWRHAFSITATAYPIEDQSSEEGSTEEVLYAFAKAILNRIFSEDEKGLFAKLLYHEMAEPTLALEKIAQEALFPQSRQVEKIIQTVLGDAVDSQVLMGCKLSIIGQCAFYNFSRPLRGHILGKETLTERELDRMARHITQFSVGGLKEMMGCE